MSMSFNVGRHQLKDGTFVSTPHTNLVPGDQVVKDGTSLLPNGTYQTDVKEFTIHEGKIGTVNDLPSS
jgi:hypothetical protein